MERNDSGKKQISSERSKTRKGDTERTSSQGRKESSGGDKETNNRGHQKGNQGTTKP